MASLDSFKCRKTLTVGAKTYEIFSLKSAEKHGLAGSVRFIANGAVSNQVFGTPFGNAGRNILRDYHLNTTNIAIFKTTNISERVHVQFHVDFINAFNHPNFGLANLNGIDPFIDDAGLAQEFTGFANPAVQDGGIRSIRFGLKLQF